MSNFDRIGGPAAATAALGDPAPYHHAGAIPVHAPFDIRRDHFELVVIHLVDTLGELGVDHRTVDAIARTLRVRSAGRTAARSGAGSPSDASPRVVAHRL